MPEKKATERPWTLSTLCHIAVATTARTTEWIHGNGAKTTHPLPVAVCATEQIPADEQEANAALIVNAVNAFPALLAVARAAAKLDEGPLVAAMKGLKTRLEMMVSACCEMTDCSEDVKVIEMAESALAAADDSAISRLKVAAKKVIEDVGETA